MRVALRRAVVLSAIVLSCTVWSSVSHAAENESFGIAPQPLTVNGVTRSSFEIPLDTGVRYQDEVRVYNKTDQPLDLTLYGADATGSGPNDLAIGFRDQHPTGVGAWISLARTKVSLAPHGGAAVRFIVDVRSSNPSPAIGAIVAENTATGLPADLAERLSVLVRTVPANSTTTSTRVRPYLLRSPWVVVAIVGLVAVLALVVLVWRRSRRTRDRVVPPGEVEGADHLQPIPVASLPVIRRLGRDEDDEDDPSRPILDDLLVEVDEPLTIDAAISHDDDEDEDAADDLPPARRRAKPSPPKPARSKPAPRKRKPVAAKPKPVARRKRAAPRQRKAHDAGYIPLDDL
jgi:hypothetical protein